MGAHAEWTEILGKDIDSMGESRAELAALIKKETELRKVIVSEQLSDARELVEKLRHEHEQRASELRESLGEFGADVREAAEIWQNRTANSRRERTRPEEEPGEPQVKREKKKGKHG